MFSGSNRSFLRLHTRSLPSAKLTLNRDSSVIRTSFHCLWIQRRWVLAHAMRVCRWRWVYGTAVRGLRARQFAERSLFLTLWPHNLTPVARCNSSATLGAAMKRLRLDVVTIKRSCLIVVLRVRPERCRSLMFPVVLNQFKNRHMVEGCTLNSWATSLCEQPAVNIPIARWRSFSESPGRFPIRRFCNFSPVFL